MVSKNNFKERMKGNSRQVQHFGIRKLSIGAASVLLGTTLFFGADVVHADTVSGANTGEKVDEVQKSADTAKPEISDQSEETKAVKEADKTNAAKNSLASNTEKTDSEQSVPSVPTTSKNSEAKKADAVDKQENTAAKADNSAKAADSKKSAEAADSDAKTNEAKVKAKSTDAKETTNEQVLKDAQAQAGKLVDDQSHDYDDYQTGKSQSVTLDGSTLSIDKDILNGSTDTANLTFKAANFKAGDTYTILIPAVYMNGDASVAHLDPSYGTTSVERCGNYWKITNKFTNSGASTISQPIVIRRNSDVNLSSEFKDSASTAYWRPYDLIRGNIQIIKNTDVKSLGMNYQLGGLAKSTLSAVNLNNGSVTFPIVNNSNLDLSIADFGQAFDKDNCRLVMTSNGAQDVFGNANDVLKDLSFSIKVPDYVSLVSDTGRIGDANTNIGSFKMTKTGNEITVSNVHFNDDTKMDVLEDQSQANSKFRLHIMVHVAAPDSVFDENGQANLQVTPNNFKLQSANPKVSLAPDGITTDFKLLEDRDRLTGYLFKYSDKHSHADLHSGNYYDGSKQVYIDNKRYSVTLGKNDTYGPLGDLTLGTTNYAVHDVNYVVSIPDGFDLYSFSFANWSVHNRDHVNKVTVTLADGTVVDLSQSDLKTYSGLSLSSGLKDNKQLKIDSNSHIKTVAISYSLIPSNTTFGLGLQKYTNGYKIADHYVSGQDVSVGDMLKFTANVSSSNPQNKINSDIVLEHTLITDPDDEVRGLYLKGFTQQNSKTPATADAGYITYEASNYEYGDPHLQHPIFYIQVPANAAVSNLQDIKVVDGSLDKKEQDNKQLTPKAVSVITENGFTFIKVDLSNYNEIKRGVSVRVPYGNVRDSQTETKASAFLVTADNLADYSTFTDGTNAQKFTSDPDTNLNAAFQAIISKDGVDANKTAYVSSNSDVTPKWDTLVADGMSTATLAGGNNNAGPVMNATQDINGAHADSFEIYGTAINATDKPMSGVTQIINIPSTTDGSSQFDPELKDKIHFINTSTGANLDDLINVSYSTTPTDLTNLDDAQFNGVSADQVTDWSKIKSVKITFKSNEVLPTWTSARAVLDLKDPHVYDHVNKSIYVSNVVWALANNTNDNSKYLLKPVWIAAGSQNSVKLTITGKSTLTTWVHYKDNSGQDHYVQLPDKPVTYEDGKDTMKRSDFMSSDSNLTDYDKAQLPTNLVINWSADPTIQNSNKTYLDGYANKPAQMDKQVAYDFDGDKVVFEGAFATPVSQTKTVKRTIHYKYADGSTASPDVVQTSKTFTVSGMKNPFTGEVKWNLSGDSDQLAEVVSPTIAGYTADKAKVSQLTVNSQSKDSEETVTYTQPLGGTITITFIDMNTGQTLKTVTPSVKPIGTASDYTTNADINYFRVLHYHLEYDQTDGQTLVFKQGTQSYRVGLSHPMDFVTRKWTVNETIHYVYDDGTKAHDDYTNSMSITEDGSKDEVTGITKWHEEPDKQFGEVVSPNIAGYTADQASIPAISVNYGSANITRTVKYSPNTQKASVTYIDDTTGNQLEEKDLSGKSDQDSGYTTQATIKKYTDQHYVLVSDSTGGNHVVFDHDDKADQKYEVHLRHDIQDVEESRPKTLIVHYVYAAGQAKTGKAADDKSDSVVFSRTGKHDLVLNQTTWNAWTSPSFNTITSPVIKGYTADQTAVTASVTPDSAEKTELTVTYKADKQNLTVKFIDDDDKQKILKTVSKTGASDTDAGYNTSADINDYVNNQHYVLVSDSTNGAELVFDHDNGTDQTYEVHLKHATQPIHETKNIKRTIHYQFENGTKAFEDKVQTVSFSRDGVHDEVTKADNWQDWTPASGTFEMVESPTKAGYKPSKANVAKITVDPSDKDIEETIIYTPEEQKLTVTFIDETNGKTLKTVSKSGASDSSTGYNTKDDIAGFIAQHYILTSDETNGDTLVFGHDNVVHNYVVKLNHAHKDVTDTKTVEEVIHYVYEDGSKAHDDYSATPITFKRSGKQDLVTTDTVWQAWTPVQQQFAAVASPAIAGYTPDKAAISAKVVTPDSSDLELKVVYRAIPIPPDNPEQPDKPETPVQPSKPDKPEQPDKPENPGKPEQPSKPAQPDEQPERPHRPGQTADEPLRPDRPAQPGQPAEQPTTTQAAQNKLPQTGNKDSRSALAAGFIGLAGLLTLLGLRKRKHN